MACRIQNTGQHTLTLDLRGGRTIHLRPGEISRELADEALYGNNDIFHWERRGLIRRTPVVKREQQAPPPEPEASEEDGPVSAEDGPAPEKAQPPDEEEAGAEGKPDEGASVDETEAERSS